MAVSQQLHFSTARDTPVSIASGPAGAGKSKEVSQFAVGFLALALSAPTSAEK
jgi:hypothetical protein